MKYFLIAGVLVLSACSSTHGQKVTQDQFDGFKAGKTTYSQLLAELGVPTVETEESDGTKQVYYTHNKMTTDPKSFIPVVGAVIGGAKSEMKTYGFSFNADGVLIKSLTSSHESKSGLIN